MAEKEQEVKDTSANKSQTEGSTKHVSKKKKERGTCRNVTIVTTDQRKNMVLVTC